MILTNPPQCVFCNDAMYGTTIGIWNGLPKNERLSYYICSNHGCFVNCDFPRYKVAMDSNGSLIEQEYAIDDIYVKVFPEVSFIYHLEACCLLDEVRVPRALWLNSTNIEKTLDTLKLMIMLS
jgi:hypothetical protein